MMQKKGITTCVSKEKILVEVDDKDLAGFPLSDDRPTIHLGINTRRTFTDVQMIPSQYRDGYLYPYI